MFLYVHKYPPARPSEANFALPEPARSPKSQKKAGSSPPKARKLEARTSLINIMRNSFDISIVLYFLNFFIFKNISLLDENNWKSIIIFIVFAFLSCEIFRGYDKCKVYNALNESMLYNLFKNVYYKTRKTNSILNFTLKTWNPGVIPDWIIHVPT